ncbi:hypothetical protein [Comamonas sp.]|uniref:hypothetical protein n=1 Tax=Comamonas sp. TaxID=34028 RepID=UPI00289E7430|nr:hypothetical protein [Comamonas sp.]
MALDYLDFEYSEDEDGNGTWDAMASVADSRWQALLAEVRQVLQWASQDFRGRRAPLDEGGDWDYDLSAQDDDNGRALHLRWNASSAQLDAPTPQTGGYLTLTLTLTGNAAFGDALRQKFELE